MSAHYRFGALGHHVVAGFLLPVLGLEHQPLRLGPLRAAGAHQMPFAVELLPVEAHAQMALLALFARSARRNDLVPAAVPDERVSRAVFAVGDASLEVAVLERMILRLDGEALLIRIV